MESKEKAIPCLWKASGTGFSVSSLKGTGSFQTEEIGLVGRPTGIRFVNEDIVQLAPPVTLGNRWCIVVQFQLSVSTGAPQDRFTLVADVNGNPLISFQKEMASNILPPPQSPAKEPEANAALVNPNKEEIVEQTPPSTPSSSKRDSTIKDTPSQPQTPVLSREATPRKMDEKTRRRIEKLKHDKDLIDQIDIKATDEMVYALAIASPNSKTQKCLPCFDLLKLHDGWHTLRISVKDQEVTVSIDNLPFENLNVSFIPSPVIGFIGRTPGKSDPFYFPIVDLTLHLNRSLPLRPPLGKKTETKLIQTLLLIWEI